MTYKIEVTQSDIELGCMRENKNCPVARALQRVLGEGWATDGDTIYNYGTAKEGVWIDIKAPKSVREFVKLYDDGLSGKPFNFKLEVSGWSQYK